MLTRPEGHRRADARAGDSGAGVQQQRALLARELRRRLAGARGAGGRRGERRAGQAGRALEGRCIEVLKEVQGAQGGGLVRVRLVQVGACMQKRCD
jgi:hypothetical protein